MQSSSVKSETLSAVRKADVMWYRLRPEKISGDTKVTDLLYACYDRAAQGKEFGGIFQEIKERYYEIIRGLDLKLSLEEEFAQIEADFRAQAGTDYAASRGEFLNGKLWQRILDMSLLTLHL